MIDARRSARERGGCGGDPRMSDSATGGARLESDFVIGDGCSSGRSWWLLDSVVVRRLRIFPKVPFAKCAPVAYDGKILDSGWGSPSISTLRPRH
jgi:hypothetical protein